MISVIVESVGSCWVTVSIGSVGTDHPNPTPPENGALQKKFHPTSGMYRPQASFTNHSKERGCQEPFSLPIPLIGTSYTTFAASSTLRQSLLLATSSNDSRPVWRGILFEEVKRNSFEGRGRYRFGQCRTWSSHRADLQMNSWVGPFHPSFLSLDQPFTLTVLRRVIQRRMAGQAFTIHITTHSRWGQTQKESKC